MYIMHYEATSSSDLRFLSGGDSLLYSSLGGVYVFWPDIFVELK
jgi:hypothetical protein